jgi:enolase-phosphatase E1
MIDASRSRLILLDIEGTVAPIAFVKDVLYPYARQHAEAFLRVHWNDAAIADARKMLDPTAADFSEAALISLLQNIDRLMESDVKSTGLKAIQGQIWDEGYRRGAFASPVFADVAPALQRWTKAAKKVAIYSSGSIAAQKVFFRYTTAGDLTPLLIAYFDTTTGPKRSPESYARIAESLALQPQEILFISDVVEEVAAARTAGVSGVIAVRPGNAPVTATHVDQIRSFNELSV